MKRSLLQYLCCPGCKGTLKIEPPDIADVIDGLLGCPGCGWQYPVRGGIPRFVADTTYADSFGLQWNRFARTQLDSFNGTTISRDRFVAQTGWGPGSLSGRLVLDGGCGAGRFAEIALSLGAEVIAIDCSSAVDACADNLRQHSERLHVVQADLYELPFRPGTFDGVYSLGVLQHTPNVCGAFKALAQQVGAGGTLVADVYLKNWAHMLHPKRVIRPLAAALPHERLLSIVARTTPPLLTLAGAVRRLPLFGEAFRRAVPVADYTGVYPLTSEQLREWAILDTFDWYGPRYDKPQTPATFRNWFTEAGFEVVTVFRAHHLTGRGVRHHLRDTSDAAGR